MGNLFSATPPNGSRLGRYNLLCALGQGGMADVHLARMRGPAGFDKLVVVKQIRPELAEDPDVLRMFLDEARIAARLAHPNVVQTHEVGQDGERYFLAMEFLDGQPLSRVRSRLHEHGGLPLLMHLRVLADVLAGLQHAHELTDYDGSPLGVVHRDVTPQNVFVTYGGAVKVVDFGIAKAKGSVAQTRVGHFKGKVTYMPREQALGERVDRRADVFAVGVMLWEAVAGQRPWAGLDAPTLLRRLVSGRFPALRDVSPGAPEELVAIVQKALAPRREDRYATAGDFQAALEAYLERCGDHTRPRELGALLQRHFAPERNELRALIEQHMRRGHEEGEGAGTAVTRVEERATIPEPAVVRKRTPSSSFESPGAGSFSAIESPAVVPARPRRRRALMTLAPLAFAGLMAGVLHYARAPRSAASPAASPEAAAVAPPAPAAEMDLVVSATPGAATLFLDGVPVAPRTRVPRDGAAHEVRAEAPGFTRGVQQVVFDGDRTVSLALEPAPPVAARPPAARPAQGGRRVDERNPYLPR